jgi:hypothetical protein
VRASRLFVVAGACAFAVLAFASTADSQDINVTTTSDAADFGGTQQVVDLPGSDGLVSLREAIIAASNTSGPQIVGFSIPTSDAGFDGTVFVIQPTSNLPVLFGGGTTIDGSTQASFSGDTNPAGPEIVLDGSLLDEFNGIPELEPMGLMLYSPDNHIHSLVIHSFASIGIEIADSRNLVTGCYIGEL